jgi:alpha-galactosidase
LCHSVPHTAREIASDLGVPPDEVRYLVAGINHMAFYLKLERHHRDGRVEDLYGQVREFAAREVYTPRVSDDMPWGLTDAVRYEVFKHFGYSVTESSEHFSEYVPWFIKAHRPDLLEQFQIPLDEYIRRCERQIERWDELRRRLEHPEEQLEVKRSVEYGSLIIHSQETGQPRVIYGNVPNHGLIDNLPDRCCVEVPCLVDSNGVQPTRVGALPLHLAALMRTNVSVQELTAEAAITGNLEHIYHAAMLDPHTAAELDLRQIRNLVTDLLHAHRDLLPPHLRLESEPQTVQAAG